MIADHARFAPEALWDASAVVFTKRDTPSNSPYFSLSMGVVS